MSTRIRLGRSGDTEKELLARIKAFQRSSRANKSCADCLDVAPTYVCMNFGTFVCTTCAGLHREFSHKVKGISVSTWALNEIEFIESHGNDVAQKVYMPRYTEDVAQPQPGDCRKLRQWIRMKYVDKRWSAERQATDEEPQRKKTQAAGLVAGHAAGSPAGTPSGSPGSTSPPRFRRSAPPVADLLGLADPDFLKPTNDPFHQNAASSSWDPFGAQPADPFACAPALPSAAAAPPNFPSKDLFGSPFSDNSTAAAAAASSAPASEFFAVKVSDGSIGQQPLTSSTTTENLYPPSTVSLIKTKSYTGDPFADLLPPGATANHAAMQASADVKNTSLFSGAAIPGAVESLPPQLNEEGLRATNMFLPAPATYAPQTLEKANGGPLQDDPFADLSTAFAGRTGVSSSSLSAAAPVEGAPGAALQEDLFGTLQPPPAFLSGEKLHNVPKGFLSTDASSYRQQPSASIVPPPLFPADNQTPAVAEAPGWTKAPHSSTAAKAAVNSSRSCNVPKSATVPAGRFHGEGDIGSQASGLNLALQEGMLNNFPEPSSSALPTATNPFAAKTDDFGRLSFEGDGGNESGWADFSAVPTFAASSSGDPHSFL